MFRLRFSSLRSRLTVLAALSVGFYSAVFAAEIPKDNTVVPEPYAPEKATRTMEVPEGFKVQLFASEPMVRQPISMCLDGRGRVWVAEALNYPDRFQEPIDRIVILEDTNGDGAADKRTVFYDKLKYVTGLEVGFGGAWVMSPPNMYFIPDKDGDDIPDGEPQILLDGFGIKESRHNLANGFNWGPDGWLYAGHGRTSPSDVGKPGAAAGDRIHFDGGVFRYHPTRHVFEPFCDGTTNPWGVGFDDHGQAFISNCVNPHIYHAIQGAHYEPWRNRVSSKFAYTRLPTIADHVHWADGKGGHKKLGLIPNQVTTGGGHAHVGMMIYLGDNWPDRYRNQSFFFNVHGRRMNNDRLERKGSSYVATHGEDFLVSKDPWFMGITLRYGPDGGVYFTDWSDTGECHSYQNTRKETGRIYKIVYGDPKPYKGDIAKRSDAELVKLQLHKNDWFVTHARKELQRRVATGLSDSTALVERLRPMFREQTDVTRKLRVMWALNAIGALKETMLSKGLQHEHESVRAWSVRLITDSPTVSRQALEAFSALAREDESALVRLHLASALQKLPFEDRWEIAEGLAGRGEDAKDAMIPLMIWYGVEPMVKPTRGRVLTLASHSKIPLLRQYIARRMAEPD
jgi:putative membrane-bound dehydrogenase-like protein